MSSPSDTGLACCGHYQGGKSDSDSDAEGGKVQSLFFSGLRAYGITLALFEAQLRSRIRPLRGEVVFMSNGHCHVLFLF